MNADKKKERSAADRLQTGRRSLIRQAVLAVISAEVFCLVLLALLAVTHEWQIQLRAMDVALEGRADSIFGAVQDAEDTADSVRLDPREMKLPGDDLFAVVDEHGHLLGGSSSLLEHTDVENGPPTWKRTQMLGGRRYRVLRRRNMRVVDPNENGGHGFERPITIVYATPLDRIWRDIFQEIGFFLAISVFLTLISTALISALMRRVLRPLADLARAASAVSPRRLELTPPSLALETRELRPLASALAEMIAELRKAFDRQHQFLGDAAHELKTAVAVVRSSMQLLMLRERSASEYRAGLQRAVEDSGRVEELVSRMLLMARLDEPAAPKDDSSSVYAVTAKCMLRAASIAEQAQVRLEWNRARPHGATGEVDARVRVPAADLEVLLSNLLMNAIEHSQAGAAVSIDLAEHDGRVTIRVIDEGEGIAEEALPFIFERFYRADSSRARSTGGAGLGLAIAKAIAERSGGRITVQSRLGQGTVLSVELPLGKISPPAECNSSSTLVFK